MWLDILVPNEPLDNFSFNAGKFDEKNYRRSVWLTSFIVFVFLTYEFLKI